MGKSLYKVVDLFGNEHDRFIQTDKKKTNTSLLDYNGFVEKFEVKKTTDDCYTPDDVYKIVLDYVHENYDLTDKEIIRPFFPGGDFEIIEYSDNSVVIDNPPFSIISKICRFYISKKIPFFLFAPHLTLFSSNIDCTHIVVGGNIIYENGANVKTSFLSNMFGNAKIIGNSELYKAFNDLNKRKKANLPKYEYPDHVLTVSQMSYIVERGISFTIDKEHAHHCSVLDDQKLHKKTIFGSGFLISDQAAMEKAAMEKAAMEKDDVIYWKISEREQKIIDSLGSR
jgi:hypothetical protein